ncbi:MAG TPA: rod shape-determining protein MreC [Steroidobacteraceae bacterium]|jgi:rod shape-determining protein MreC|nr:rod shape-determining protein MreC [Steroidobacteraceae bacterium]
MVAFRSAESRPILGRGPSPGLRFFFFGLLAIGLMWLDQRQGYLEAVRRGMSMVTYPIQVAVDSPAAFWDWLSDLFATRERLRKENEQLKLEVRDADFRLMRYADLEQENLRLRGLRDATSRVTQRFIVAEILRVDLNPFRQRVIINKGTRDGAFKGQAILDASGVFGQITQVGTFSSEAILITDSEHAIPVQVNRNGLRTIAVGTGEFSLRKLSLPFLATNADIKVGDLLVSSGLGGVFPPGYPVATVTKVDKAVAQTLAEITAEPAAKLDRDREVLLIWSDEPPIDVAPDASATPATPPAKGSKP